MESVICSAEIQDNAAVCLSLSCDPLRTADAAAVLRLYDQIFRDRISSRQHPDLLSLQTPVQRALQIERRPDSSLSVRRSVRCDDQRRDGGGTIVFIFDGHGIQVYLHLATTGSKKSQIHRLRIP